MTEAVLLIDVQNGVLPRKAGPDRQPVIDAAFDRMVERLRSLRARARAAGVPVILVQHDGGKGHRLAPGSPGWAIRAELAPDEGDPVVRKRSCDSFFETGLADRLSELSATHLIIGGCMTEFCIDTTVRRAVSLGYDVTLLEDGHMTEDSQRLPFSDIVAHHNETLDGFDAGRARVVVRPTGEIVF